MNILERTAGNAFTRDPDYAAFTGRVVRTYTTTYYEPRLKAFVKRTVEYIDVGKPDKVTPVNHQEAMTPDLDFLPREHKEHYAKGWDAAKQANKRRSDKYHALLQRLIVAHLQAHGPMRNLDIARALRISHTTIYRHLTARVGTIYQREGKMWSLAKMQNEDAT